MAVVAACGRRGGSGAPPKHTNHAPVDPALDLAIAIPDTMESVLAGDVFVERAPHYDTAAAWASAERARSGAYTVGEPVPDGDGWALTITAKDPGSADILYWYRPLGGGISIKCTPTARLHAQQSQGIDLARKECFGTQHIAGDIYVPFQMSAAQISLDVALDEHSFPHVSLESFTDTTALLFDPKAAGNYKVIDKGQLADGSWWIASRHRDDKTEYMTATRRKIGDLDLICDGANVGGDADTRRQLALCRDLEQP